MRPDSHGYWQIVCVYETAIQLFRSSCIEHRARSDDDFATTRPSLKAGGSELFHQSVELSNNIGWVSDRRGTGSSVHGRPSSPRSAKATPRPEAKPETACVSRAQSCRKSIAAKAAASAAAPPRPGTAPGLRRQRLSFNAMNSVTQSAGCFLGDMEDKLLVDAESGVLQVYVHGVCMVCAWYVP